MMKAHHKDQTATSVTMQSEPRPAMQLKRSVRRKTTSQQETGGPARKRHRGRGLMSCGPSPRVDRGDMAAFLKLLDDDLIQYFMWKDPCYKMSDKYLLAMVFVYFRRASLRPSEHTRMNFFLALCLAINMEEEDRLSTIEIFSWALGENWRRDSLAFLKARDRLWACMGFRAAVCRHCCEEVMAVVPFHLAWKRERAEHHSGIQRLYSVDLCRPRGPSASPLHCSLCDGGVPNSTEDLSATSSSPLLFALSPAKDQTSDDCSCTCSGISMSTGQSSGCEEDASQNQVNEENCNTAPSTSAGNDRTEMPAPSVLHPPFTDRSPTSTITPGLGLQLPWPAPPPPGFVALQPPCLLQAPGLPAQLFAPGFQAQFLPPPPFLPGFRGLLLPPQTAPPGFIGLLLLPPLPPPAFSALLPPPGFSTWLPPPPQCQSTN